MKKIALLLLISLVVFSSADLYKDLEKKVDKYNENVGKVPAIFKKIFANQRVNAYISMNDGSELIIGVVIGNNMRITEFTKGGIKNPTLIVRTDEKTVNDIMNSDSPGKDAVKALEDGRIKIEAVGFVNKIKFVFVKFSIKLLKLFGRL